MSNFREQFADTSFDSKIDAVVALSCLLQGPTELGNSVLGRPGVMDILLALVESKDVDNQVRVLSLCLSLCLRPPLYDSLCPPLYDFLYPPRLVYLHLALALRFLAVLLPHLFLLSFLPSLLLLTLYRPCCSIPPVSV